MSGYPMPPVQVTGSHFWNVLLSFSDLSYEVVGKALQRIESLDLAGLIEQAL